LAIWELRETLSYRKKETKHLRLVLGCFFGHWQWDITEPSQFVSWIDFFFFFFFFIKKKPIRSHGNSFMFSVSPESGAAWGHSVGNE
jgi:hypothetical protein